MAIAAARTPAPVSAIMREISREQIVGQSAAVSRFSSISGGAPSPARPQRLIVEAAPAHRPNGGRADLTPRLAVEKCYDRTPRPSSNLSISMHKFCINNALRR
jgi:hypothetical protein